MPAVDRHGARSDRLVMALRDLSAFAPADPLARLDADGIPIPEHWIQEKWEKMPAGWRKAYSDGHFAPKPEPAPKKRRVAGKRFSTDYAIEWGRKQGWKLLDRERYDARLKRHHDLMMGVDALFETPDGMVGVQGAGLSEHKAHYQRFTDRGGVPRAQKLHVRVVYLEFARGDKTPRKVEWWA